MTEIWNKGITENHFYMNKAQSCLAKPGYPSGFRLGDTSIKTTKLKGNLYSTVSQFYNQNKSVPILFNPHPRFSFISFSWIKQQPSKFVCFVCLFESGLTTHFITFLGYVHLCAGYPASTNRFLCKWLATTT